jgi:hypothetical protein
MRSYRDQQTSDIADLNRVRDDLPDTVWVTQERGRWKRVGEIRQEAPCQVIVQNISCYVLPPPSSALAGFRSSITNGARMGILTALCLVLMSPDSEAIHILILAAIFSVLGMTAGAMIYVLLSIVVSLLKIGLLVVAAVVVSGLVIKGCTPTIEKVATEKTATMQIGLDPQIDLASSGHGFPSNSDGVPAYKPGRSRPRRLSKGITAEK